jgi:hypothetical protein
MKAPIPIVASVLVPEKTTELRELVPRKAVTPIDVTLAGIVMEVSPLLSKALSPIDVTLSGIGIELRFGVPLNA